MCQIGDIIVIYSYKSQGRFLKAHSFVVLDDTKGKIHGMKFDMINLVMSSFKDKEQKTHKMRYKGNFPITPRIFSIY